MKVLVNADDYGFSKSCTDAIFDCFTEGLITTTTACSNGDFFDYGVSLIVGTPYEDKIGLHINLTEGKPLTENIKANRRFCDINGEFIGFPNRYKRLSKIDKNDICCEMQAQIDRFVNAGLKIHHLDSHHHIHNSFRLLPLFIKVAKMNNIKYIRILRNVGNISAFKKIYKKAFNFLLKHFSYSQYMGSIDDYSNFHKKDASITIEIMVHPDYDKSGIIIDRTNADYSKPEGSPLTSKYIRCFYEN